MSKNIPRAVWIVFCFLFFCPAVYGATTAGTTEEKGTMENMKEFMSGRTGHPLLKELKKYLYAHRGLYGENGVPENSMAAFQAAIDHGYGVELDVHLTKDGELVVIHDSNTLSVTGESMLVEEAALDELKKLRLEGTEEEIPTFDEVLALFEDKAPLIIELKAEGNRKELAQAVCKRLETYHGLYCIESFDPLIMWEVRKLAPDTVRGQLSWDFDSHMEEMPAFERFILTNLYLDFLSRPDFIAYCFEDRNNQSLQNALKKGIQEVSWTIVDQETLDQVLAVDSVPIFEHFMPDPAL